MNAQECPFCHSKRKPIAANEYSFAVRDSFPVSRGHALVIPTRHVASIMELNNVLINEHNGGVRFGHDEHIRYVWVRATVGAW